MTEPQYSYCFFQILGWFVLTLFCGSYNFWTCIHICIFIIHAEYFWLVMAGLKEIFYTLIQKFVYITFCLLTKSQAMLQLKILMLNEQNAQAQKFLLSLCILFIHWLFVCQVSIDLIISHPWSFFWVLASSLVIVLKLFLIFSNLVLGILYGAGEACGGLEGAWMGHVCEARGGRGDTFIILANFEIVLIFKSLSRSATRSATLIYHVYY